MDERESSSSATTKFDRWDYPIQTKSADCIDAVNSYYEEFLNYGRNCAVILKALTFDPDCVLANVLAAYQVASKKPTRAAELLDAAATLLENGNGTGYERLVFGAVSCLVGGGSDEAAAIDRHTELLNEFPKDLVSLKRAQVICFYLGRPEISLKFVEQVLPHNQDQSYVYGMLSFPLLELGRMAEAESAARKGYEINKYDLWSQHCGNLMRPILRTWESTFSRRSSFIWLQALFDLGYINALEWNLCHVLQYECRFEEAVDFMEYCSCTWNFCSSFMFTHNWWHVAVCYLEGHSPMHKVLEIYDHYIWKELQRSDAECGEVYANALGLLLRIDVRGYRSCIEDRITVLANIFEDKSVWHMEWLLDILALWVLACKKESTKAEDLLKSMKSRFCMMSTNKQNSMQSGVKLAEAIYEYGRGNYHKAYGLLGPDFDATRCKMIGASDEQLDVFTEVWYDVMLKIKQISEAIEDIKKAVKKREGAPFLWRLLARAYAMQGAAEASATAEKANALESAYFK